MNNRNIKHNDFQAKCFKLMKDLGIPCKDEHLACDNQFHHYSSSEGREKLSEWYIYAYIGKEFEKKHFWFTCGSFRYDIKKTIKSFQDYEISSEDLKKINDIHYQELTKVKTLTLELHDKRHAHCADIWRRAMPTMPTDTILKSTPKYRRYIDLKGIVPYGAKYDFYPDKIKKSISYSATVLAIVDIDLKIWNLQYIYINDEGECFKRFVRGAKKKGCFGIVGDLHESFFSKVTEDTIFYITEGWADGCVIKEELTQTLGDKFRVIFALDAGNLPHVSRVIRNKFKTNPIFIIADNDEVGIKKANESAEHFNCKVLVSGKDI